MLTYTFENSVSDMIQVHQGDDGREDKQMRGGGGGMINQIGNLLAKKKPSTNTE